MEEAKGNMKKNGRVTDIGTKGYKTTAKTQTGKLTYRHSEALVRNVDHNSELSRSLVS